MFGKPPNPSPPTVPEHTPPPPTIPGFPEDAPSVLSLAQSEGERIYHQNTGLFVKS